MPGKPLSSAILVKAITRRQLPCQASFVTSSPSRNRIGAGADDHAPFGVGPGSLTVDGGPDLEAQGAGTGQPVGFAPPNSAAAPPPAPSLRRRLAHLALDAVNRVVPKTPDRVVLHSTIDLEDGVLAVAEELSSRGWTPTILLERPNRAAQVHQHTGGRVRTVAKKSARGVLQYLTAHYVVTTYAVFGDTRPPGSQVLVNIWHGDPPSGKVIARFFPGRGGLRCTYTPVLSTLGRAFRATEFGLHPSQVPVVGAARNDRMLRADAKAVRRAVLGDAADRPTFLWLPTFRESVLGTISISAAHPGVPFSAADLERLDRWLTQNSATVVIKLHPHDAASFSGNFEAIRIVTQEEMEQLGLTMYTMLPAFDGLLTDVSSVWVDYLLLDKPMVFAFPDIQDYRDGRGLSIEPYEDWVPGPFVRDIDGVIDALADLVAGRDPMAHERGLARVRFHHHRDDRSAARLLDGLGISSRTT
jgi:CDP-glycerol glycerophosphotransferase